MSTTEQTFHEYAKEHGINKALDEARRRCADSDFGRDATIAAAAVLAASHEERIVRLERRAMIEDTGLPVGLIPVLSAPSDETTE